MKNEKSLTKPIVIVDDTAKDEGGAAKTLLAYLEGLNVLAVIPTASLSVNVIEELPRGIIFALGNCTHLTAGSNAALNFLAMTRRFVKFEFDYGFCKYRCEQGFKRFTGLDSWEPSGPHGDSLLWGSANTLSRFCENQLFMSESQMKIFASFMPSIKGEVVSSTFADKDFALMDEIWKARNGGWVNTLNKCIVVDGNGGWHSEAKGVAEAVMYCKNNNLDFDMVKCGDYHTMLQTMGRYRELVFLPIIHDTCPRLVIEAALMGLKVTCNANCQHISEPWFSSLDRGQISAYLLGRKKYVRELFAEKVSN